MLLFVFIIFSISLCSCQRGSPLFVFKEIRNIDQEIHKVINGIDRTVFPGNKENQENQENHENPHRLSFERIGSGLDVVDIQELLDVLRPDLETARCLATCHQILDPRLHAFKTCNQTCSRLYRNQAWRMICGTETCGYGCSTACSSIQTQSTLRHGIDISAELDGCRLFWKAEMVKQSEDTVEYLVAARDGNNMLYHVGSTQTNSIQIPETLMEKSANFLVVGVSPRGLVGVQSIAVDSSQKHCSRHLELLMDVRDKKSNSKPVILLSILSSILIFSVFLLVFFSMKYRARQLEKSKEKKVSAPQTPNEDFYDDYAHVIYPYYPDYDIYMSSPVIL